jgi:hypothetical protein
MNNNGNGIDFNEYEGSGGNDDDDNYLNTI